jgi:hypothetical protein
LRALLIVLLGLTLTACGPAVNDALDKFWGGPEARARQAEADDAKCKNLGFKPGTDGYGNCRLQLEQIRATQNAATAQQLSQEQKVSQSGKVYNRDECIGPVIMGRCEGTIAPQGGYRPTCHGQWINGQCTGPMF